MASRLERLREALERQDQDEYIRIYDELGPEEQRQADLILAGMKAHYEDRAGLGLEKVEELKRLALLLEEHGVATVGDLPPDVLAQIEADLTGLFSEKEESDGA